MVLRSHIHQNYFQSELNLPIHVWSVFLWNKSSSTCGIHLIGRVPLRRRRWPPSMSPFVRHLHHSFYGVLFFILESSLARSPSSQAKQSNFAAKRRLIFEELSERNSLKWEFQIIHTVYQSSSSSNIWDVSEGRPSTLYFKRHILREQFNSFDSGLLMLQQQYGASMV